MTDAVAAEGLVKSYGDAKRALDGIDLRVPEGTVLGLLGPNGAGKTTAVRILTTLLQPDAGRAQVQGIDVLADPDRVRALIGLAGQYAAVDGLLTGRENLRMVGDLYHLSSGNSKQRADELLRRFGLSDAADRPVKGYSGGMRRRLDLAASLVNRPPVLFLDEPTTGLDPRSRIGLWEVIEALVADGTTLLLTTQYLEEADRLADRIAVIDHGTVIAEGTADTLKQQVGGERVEVVVTRDDEVATARDALAGLGTGETAVDARSRRLTVPVSGGASVLVEAVRRLDDAGVGLHDVGLRRPTLDDVFLSLTGRTAEGEPDGEQEGEQEDGQATGQKEAPAGVGAGQERS